MKNSRNVIDQRHKDILQYLRQNSNASVSELACHFNVTTATIRRDLEVLKLRGGITRYFGGVRILLTPPIDVQYQTDKGNPTPAKLAIAQRAASMVSQDDIIFLNSSSTAVYILDNLTDIRANVITNNARALHCQYGKDVNLMLTGGEVYGNKHSLVGEFAINSIKKTTANKCFLGVSGISVAGGITSSILQEVAINQSMISQCSGPVIVVADGSKIGVKKSYFSYGINKITHLITDSSASPWELEAIRECGVQVIVVDG